jgi:hypothetical protein
MSWVPLTVYSQFIDGFIRMGNPSGVIFRGIPSVHAVSHTARVLARVSTSALACARVCIVFTCEKERRALLVFLW